MSAPLSVEELLRRLAACTDPHESEEAEGELQAFAWYIEQAKLTLAAQKINWSSQMYGKAVTTPRYQAFLSQVESLDLKRLRLTLAFVADDLYGKGEATPEDPRDFDDSASEGWSAETAYNVSESLETVDMDSLPAGLTCDHAACADNYIRTGEPDCLSEGTLDDPDEDEGTCDTEGCKNAIDDGEGYDGRCGECADKLFSEENGDEDDGCPHDDPDCLSRADECHDACDRPHRESAR